MNMRSRSASASRKVALSPGKRAPEATEQLRASLLAHAQRLIERDGASALTMRALAAEAGCALGLPYKVFADRNELVLEIIHAELARSARARDDLLARVGTGTVGGNLAWFAELLLSTPAAGLAREVSSDAALSEAATERIRESGAGPGVWETAFADYLAAEKRAGRVGRDVNEDAFAFLLAGAVHNLIMSGDAYPRPTSRRLKRLLSAVAQAIAPDTD
jgi:AcrR family transcriptional regulator